MSTRETIGIVGQGFVGTAIREGMKKYFNIVAYDKFKKEVSTCSTLEEVCRRANVVFVCLPTPMKRDRSCDLSILENVVYDINELELNNIVVIKSTVVPGTTERLNRECQNIDIVFSPEFLTEANYIDDFKSQNRIIIGGPRPATTVVKNMFRKVFQKTPIVKTGSKTAELVKYFINCFLATKVIFANEMYDICTAANIDFDKVTEYALHDGRIGKSHLMVPGPDGDRGFGGHCFPKDMEALIYFAEELDVDPALLKNVLDKNNKLRKNRDWEKMKGRAISDD